jgi:hypothetical protein
MTEARHLQQLPRDHRQPPPSQLLAQLSAADSAVPTQVRVPPKLVQLRHHVAVAAGGFYVHVHW